MPGSGPAIGLPHDVRVDPATGSLTGVIPVALPDGRNGLGPRLQLEYRIGRFQ